MSSYASFFALFVVLLGCASVNALDDRFIPENQHYFQNGAGDYVYLDCGGFPGHAVFIAGGRFSNPQRYVKFQSDDYCSKCPAGSYAPAYWMWECIATPPGFFNNYIGANVTTPCPAGSKCAGLAEQPVQCMDGTFQKYIGQTECLPCPNGYYSTYAGDGCATYQPDAPINCTMTNCTHYNEPHPWSPSLWNPKASNSSTSVWPNQTMPLNAGVPPCVFDCPITASPSATGSTGSGSSSASPSATGSNNSGGNSGNSGNNNGNSGNNIGGNTGSDGGNTGVVNTNPTGDGTVKRSSASSLSSSLVVAIATVFAFVAFGSC